MEANAADPEAVKPRMTNVRRLVNADQAVRAILANAESKNQENVRFLAAVTV